MTQVWILIQLKQEWKMVNEALKRDFLEASLILNLDYLEFNLWAVILSSLSVVLHEDTVVEGVHRVDSTVVATFNYAILYLLVREPSWAKHSIHRT